MADDLDDGEFWLPSHFLTEDDILMDFSPQNKDSIGSGSDLDLPSNGSVTGSTETESDEDELLAGLTRQMTRSTIRTDCTVNSQGWVLSSSPQSTLCGCVGKEGSSRDSPNGQLSPPPATEKDGGATWDLLYKAAGEVARIKMRSKKTTASAGTGFFDCSSKGLLCPPPRTTTTTFYSQPQFPPLSHLKELSQQQMMKPQFNLKRSNINSNKNSNRPLGLPPSAWPPLQAQPKNQPIRVVPPMFLGQPGPKRESVGTGVFLPRSVASPDETRKKTEGNPTKMRTGKGSQSHQRRSSRPPKANQMEIQLPQEWTY